MPTRMMSPTFVGRGAEISRLQSALGRAEGGESSLVLLGGDAGVGKTRLLTEFLASSGDAVVLTGGCLEVGETALPYAPLVEALRDLGRTLGPDAVRMLFTGPRREVARLLPHGDAGNLPPPVGSTSQSALFEGVLSTLETLGRDRSAILAIEDLHWADRSTLDLLRFLARNLRGGRVVVVATYRTDELHRRHGLRPVLGELVRLPSVERLDLAPFDRDELAEQLTAILGRPPGTDLVDVIADRSEGNAFYAEELLAAAQRSGGGHLPATLRDILVGRLAPLPEAATKVLRIAAAAVRSVDHRLLEQVADLPTASLRDGLREAVAHQALVTTADGRSYRFRHALMQEAVHDQLLPGERNELHAAFAEALERAPELSAGGADGVHAELAHHWFAAHDLERAFRASLPAAEVAMGQYAFAEAGSHYELVLELWDRVSDGARADAPPRHDVLRRAGHAASLGGDAHRAVAHQREAITVARDVVPPATLADLLGKLSRLLWVAGAGEQALAASEQSLAAMPEQPSRERAASLAGRGRLLMLVGRYEEAIAPSREAVEVARTVVAPLEESQALNSLGMSLAFSSDLHEAVALLRESMHLAKEVGTLDDVLRAYINLSSILSAIAARGVGTVSVADCRRRDEAVTVSQEGLQWTEDHGVIAPQADFLRLNLVDDLFFQGRWDEAEQHLERIRFQPNAGVVPARLALGIGRLRIGQGRCEEAREHLRRSQDAAGPGVIDPQFLIPFGDAEAALALWEGGPERARGITERVMAVEDRRWWMDVIIPCAAWAEADIALDARAAGDHPAAAEAGQRIEHLLALSHEALVEADADSMWAERLRGLVSQIEAERSRVSGEHGPEAWRRAVAWVDEHGAAEAAVYSRWRLAEALLAADDRDAAAAVLPVAHRRACELGAGALRKRIEGLARRARIDLPGVVTGGAGRFGLTPREREVLALVAEGATNRSIGERLYIAEKTASVHVSNILAKLGVTNRGEAAAVAHRLGLDAPA